MAVNPDYQQGNEFPTSRTTFFLSGPAGRLECVADIPESVKARAATIVICHPHPQFGGTMNNKVVTTLERAMRELGLRTLRFNFRGTGDSDGEYDEGDGETDDLLAIARWVRQARPADVLWLGGFSFGSYITTRAARRLKAAQLISIAPPVALYGFTTLPHPGCPWLVIQGDKDDIVNHQDVEQWAGRTSPRPAVEVLEGAGHFFHRRLLDLRRVLQNGVAANLPVKSSS